MAFPVLACLPEHAPPPAPQRVQSPITHALHSPSLVWDVQHRVAAPCREAVHAKKCLQGHQLHARVDELRP